MKAVNDINATSSDEDLYRATHDPDLVPILARLALLEGRYTRKQADRVSALSRNLPLDVRGQDESVPEFLARLAPSKTTDEPWIYVYRPGWQNNLDEYRLAVFIKRVMRLLERFEYTKATFKAHHGRSGGKAKTALAGKLSPIQHSLQKDIYVSAREMNVVTGKWMLFLSIGRVDAVWKAVVEATVSGELGHAAKVATNLAERSRGCLRMIIYTSKYEDTDDVRRVLEKLVALGLLRNDRRPIYYKADAYTYLRIFADNPYKLKASLFSSKDILSGKV